MIRTLPPFTPIVEALSPSKPFTAPEELERRRESPILLRLGANESAFGISPSARQAILQGIDQVSWYCDPESHELCAELARLHGVCMENLVIGSGIDDLLCLVARTFIDAGQSTVMSHGSYPTFGYFARSCDGQVVSVPYYKHRNDLDALLEAAVRLNARILYLVNPDNPTGTWQSSGDLATLIGRLPPTCVLLLDEAYSEFAPQEVVPPIDPTHPCVIRLRTFSKAHGLAGARIGYAIAHQRTISAFAKIRVQFGVNRIAQVAALASLRDPDYIPEVARAVAEGRRDYEQLAGRLGLRTLPSATNFVAFDLETSDHVSWMVAELLARGVFVRSPAAAPLNRLIRVTVGTPAERRQFGDILTDVLNACPSEPTVRRG